MPRTKAPNGLRYCSCGCGYLIGKLRHFVVPHGQRKGLALALRSPKKGSLYPVMPGDYEDLP